jgi:hypothetical protein
MTTIGVLVRPPTKRATNETIDLLGHVDFDAIFIDLPRDLECYLLDYLRHQNFELFVDQIYETMPPEDFPSSIIRGYEKLLSAICHIARGRKVYCYGSVLKNKYETELAYYTAQLTLHDSITGKVSIDKWLNILTSRNYNFSEWIKEEAEYVASEAEKHNTPICIAGYGGFILKKNLSNYFKSWIKYTGQPFHLPPIHVLTRIMSIRNMGQKEIVELIKEHIKFVREFIIPYGLEDGLELWSRKKLYWLIPPNQ